MAIEGDIKTIINPLVAGGCYPIKNTSKTIVWPYVTYQKISGIPLNTLDGSSGLERMLFQIDIYATTYNAVKTLAKSIATAMAEATFKNLCVGDRDWPEEGVEECHVIQEYSIWSA